MNYEKLYNLDTMQLCLCAIDQPMRAAAVEVPGGKICCKGAWYNDEQRLCISFTIEKCNAARETPITPLQVREYYDRHSACEEYCGYFAAQKIYRACGYVLHSVAEEINGKHYAEKWQNEWSGHEQKALNIFIDATSFDKRAGKYTRSCIISACDLLINSPQQPLQDYADMSQLDAEIKRIVAEVLEQKPKQLQINEEELNEIKRKLYDGYFKKNFDNDKTTIFGCLLQDRGKRNACKLIAKMYIEGVRDSEKYNPNRGNLLTWEKWREMWGKACGVELPKYRLVSLKN